MLFGENNSTKMTENDAFSTAQQKSKANRPFTPTELCCEIKKKYCQFLGGEISLQNQCIRLKLGNVSYLI